MQRIKKQYSLKALFETLKDCRLCPHECGVDRYSDNLGYCGSDAGFNISSIVLHKGEEPVISGENGICNVFFSRCNLQCIYCQNMQISSNTGAIISRKFALEDVISEIITILDLYKINSVGFVSPSHFAPHVIAIIEGLRSKGRNPVTVYNTNAYEKAETIRLLDSYISVYLPDFKYMNKDLAKELSGVENYPTMAALAIKEMFRQKGSTLIKNDKGIAEFGLIIRHLVLPEQIENSLKVLRFIAEELSPDISLSLMSQFYPTDSVKSHAFLNRKLSASEYDSIVNDAERLGFHRGWIQELESSVEYLPDFNETHPFEK